MEESERKKVIELLKEMRSESDAKDIKSNNEGSRLSWMYKGPSDLLDKEEYLLGKAIDKSFEVLSNPSSSDTCLGRTGEQSNVPKRVLEKTECTEQVDIAKKILEDPLYAIKQKEMEARKKLLNNPVKLKQIKQMLLERSQKVLAYNKQRKKKLKKEKLTPPELNSLLLKYLKKFSEKEKRKALQKIMQPKFDSSSERSSHENKEEKKKKNFKRSRQSSSSDSDSSSKSSSSLEDKKNTKFKKKKKVTPTGNYKKRNNRKEFSSDTDSDSRKKHRSSSKKHSSKTGSKHSKKSRASSDEYSNSTQSSSSDDESENDRKRKDKKSNTSNFRNDVKDLNRREKHSNHESEDKKERRETFKNNYDEDNSNRKTKSYGLMMPDGTKPVTKGRPYYEKYEKITETKTKYVPPPKAKPLSEKEREAKLREMMEDAKARKADREQNLASHRKKEAKEEDARTYDDDFMRRQISHLTSQESMADRIKSNLNNIQRSKSSMDGSFVKK